MARIASMLSNFTSKEVADFFSKAGALSKNPHFTLLIAPKTKDIGRILIITPRQVGTAPERNLLKRRIRALFYEEKIFEHGHDYAIILKKGAAALSFKSLKMMLLKAFLK